MECNKDEAARAKEIAERKFLAKDIKGARKFALKAQTLYPQLDGISRMVTTIDVYISAEEKINGEGNWYGVLGVNPLADDETIRKKYRTLALMLHPDKNKSLGAEGAFKIVSEAWSFLSDKYKRLAYDRRSGATHPENLAKQNGFYKFAKTAAASRMRVSRETEQPNRSATPSSGTFGFSVNCLNKSSSGKNSQWTPFSETSSVASAVRAAEMVQRVYERVRKDRQKAQANARRDEARRRKNHSSRTRLDAEAGHSVKRRKGVEERKRVECCGTSKYKMDQVN